MAFFIAKPYDTAIFRNFLEIGVPSTNKDKNICLANILNQIEYNAVHEVAFLINCIAIPCLRSYAKARNVLQHGICSEINTGAELEYWIEL